MAEVRNATKILVINLEGERSLGGPRGRWEDSIKLDCWEIILEKVSWVYLAFDRGR
jgi:hypothetical protein